jgi:hypothetical protein
MNLRLYCVEGLWIPISLVANSDILERNDLAAERRCVPSWVSSHHHEGFETKDSLYIDDQVTRDKDGQYLAGEHYTVPVAR